MRKGRVVTTRVNILEIVKVSILARFRGTPTRKFQLNQVNLKVIWI